MFPELFHKNKNGKLYSWKIWVTGNEIHTLHGTVDGEKTPSSKLCVGKNIGKANETTPEAQAQSEAQSMWQKKRDKKYRESLEEAKNEFILLPMLAKDFEKRKTKVKYPVDVQPKLDGVRCLAFWKDGRVVLLSRGAKEYTLPHIAEELTPFLEASPTLVLDGEAYAHGAGFQNSMSWIKRLQEGTKKIRYHVYDLLNLGDQEQPWLTRRKNLDAFFKLNGKFQHLEKVEVFGAKVESVVYDCQSTFLRRGYEGAIVRQHDGKYVIGGRSGDLLKVKTFQDAEFKIVDYTTGVGKFASCVIWKCVLNEYVGNEGLEEAFNVVPKGTQEERQQLLSEADSHIGKMLKVKFFEYSDDGVPRFPVGLGFRLEEDM